MSQVQEIITELVNIVNCYNNDRLHLMHIKADVVRQGMIQYFKEIRINHKEYDRFELKNAIRALNMLRDHVFHVFSFFEEKDISVFNFTLSHSCEYIDALVITLKNTMRSLRTKSGKKHSRFILHIMEKM